MRRRFQRLLRFISGVQLLYRDPEIRHRIIESDDPAAALGAYFSQQKTQRIEELEAELNGTSDRLETVRNERDRLRDTYVRQQEQRSRWNSKHPQKLVTYQRPVYTGNSDFAVHKIPVTVFVQPNDLKIRRDLRRNDLVVDTPMHVDSVVPEIYRVARSGYDYRQDSENLGRGEWWQFPFETRRNKGDCEDWANTIASYLLAAGVPSWRVRCTFGKAQSGQGHATVYVLADNMETWHHLNSTRPAPDHDTVTAYPEWGDETDSNGINPETVWGSFNDRYAWNEFESDQSAAAFDAHPVSDKLSVEQL